MVIVGGDKLQGGERWSRYRVEMVRGDSVREEKGNLLYLLLHYCPLSVLMLQ